MIDQLCLTDLSNELSYLYPGGYIVILKVVGEQVNISIRGEKAKKVLLKAIEDLEEARGGGHERAVGGKIRLKDLEKFKERVKELI